MEIGKFESHPDVRDLEDRVSRLERILAGLSKYDLRHDRHCETTEELDKLKRRLGCRPTFPALEHDHDR